MSQPDRKSSDGTLEGQVPKAVISRLSLYLRELQHMVRDGHETTNSTELGSVLGFSDAQVRKDLAYFGQFGYPGIGYRPAELITAIKQILGTNREWPAAIIGTGNLGRALLGYKGFADQGFRIVAAFDVDASTIGSRIEDVPVFHTDEIPKCAQELSIKLGLIAVPAAAAQSVAEQLVSAGIVGIVNFAPVTISLPPGVSQVGVDLAIELEQLSFAVVNSRENA